MHQMDDGMWAPFVELGAVRSRESRDMSGELDRSALHAKTETEKRNLPLPGIADGPDLSFDTSGTKTAGDQNAVRFPKNPLGPLSLHIFGFYPADIDFSFVVDPAVHQGLCEALVAFLQPGILPDQRDGNFMFGMLDSLNHGIPLT